MTFSKQLFSYGTLPLEAVQRATFGRKLDGHADDMPGYAMSMLKIEDASARPHLTLKSKAARLKPARHNREKST